MIAHSWRGVCLFVALLLALSAAGVFGVVAGKSRHDETARTLGDDVLLRDTFARQRDGPRLGHIPNGPRWDAVAGAWGVRRGEAYVAVAAEPASIAVTQSPGPPEEIGVTLTHVEDNAGLVFRYRDRNNYWAVLAAPKYATWYLIKVVDGQQAVVGKTGRITVLDPSRITIRLVGSAVEVWAEWGADSSAPQRVSDSTHTNARRAGIITIGAEASRARFENFVVTR